ncbi:hypothetical protein C8J57DRAFT_1217950 [Mycena rebaudengoi]|nr:hypothetical protein C8J57DRAFT_1217950 [Mycena rebaudengoi]
MSLDRDPISTPQRVLPRTNTASPTKLDLPDDEDDGYDSDASLNQGFSIRDRLTAPTEQLACSYLEPSISDLIHEGTIDLNPPYQRDVVWPLSKQVRLIDSIYLNYYIPPVIIFFLPLYFIQSMLVLQIVFAVQYDEEGVETRASPAFSDTLHSRTEEILVYYPGINQTFTDSRRVQETVCRQENHLRAEKLAAVDSKWASWIAQLEQRHITVEGGLSQTLIWDTTRGRQFQNVAQFVYCCDGYPGDRNVPTAPKMDKWLSRVDQPTEQFKREIDDALNDIAYLATSLNPDLKKGFTIGKKLAPVEFVFIGVLLYVLRKLDATSSRRADAVYELRNEIRLRFPDNLRMNSKVGEGMWELIHQLKNTGGHSSPSKRKRKTADDSDPEYHPSPIKSLGKVMQTRSRNAK